MERAGIRGGLVRWVVLLAGLVAMASALAQNLNQQYGSGWSCEMLLPTRYFCDARVGGRGGAYGDRCVLYDACMRCESSGQDFVKTSGTGGHCAARGSAGTESPAKPRRSESRPRETGADRAERQLDRDSDENDRLTEACLDRAGNADEGCIGRCETSDCVSACEAASNRRFERCHAESAARTERYMRRYDEALSRHEQESLAKQPSTPSRPPSTSPPSTSPPSTSPPAAPAPRPPEPAPVAARPAFRAKPAIVEAGKATAPGDACRTDPLTAKIEASLTRGDLPGISELGRLATDIAQRRERGCAMGHAKAAPNPFATHAGAAKRQPARNPDDVRFEMLRSDLEPEPPVFAGETRPDPDCLGLSQNFTLSGIGRCLRYMVKNHPAQGQSLTLDAIDRALLKELGKEGLYGTP